MKFSFHPVPRLWKPVVVGIGAFITMVYAHDTLYTLQRLTEEMDMGNIYGAPLTDPPKIWDQHVIQKLPNEEKREWAHL